MYHLRVLYLSICSLFLCVGCKDRSCEYTIQGTLPSLQYDGEWMYLTPMENATGRIDSVKISDSTFRFTGCGEEVRVLRLRPELRLGIQELLVVTEPGVICVRADSSGSVTGTPQNDTLQVWKEKREAQLAVYRQLRKKLRTSTGDDSLALVEQFKMLADKEHKTNFRFLLQLGNNTLGKFMQKMMRPSLDEAHKKMLDEALQEK